MNTIIVNGRIIRENDDGEDISFQDDENINITDEGKKALGWSISIAIIAVLLVVAPYLATLIYLVIHCPVAAIIHFIFTLLLFRSW